LISQDDFYIGAQAMRAAGGQIDNFDTVEALDIDGIVSVLNAVSESSFKTVVVPDYDYKLRAPNGSRSICSTDVVVVEGHIMFTESNVLRYVDFLVYIDIEERVAKTRRFRRDVAERGFDVQECESYYEKFVFPSIKSIERLKGKANYVLNNDDELSQLDNHVLKIGSLI
jgi:uridine kinase